MKFNVFYENRSKNVNKSEQNEISYSRYKPPKNGSKNELFTKTAYQLLQR